MKIEVATTAPSEPFPEPDGTRDHWYDRVLTRLGLKPRDSIRHDLEDALAETVEDTDFSPQERAMLKNVLGFHRIRVDDVMVPRADIVAVAADTNLGDLLNLFRTAGHSRLPVYGETLDDPEGHGPHPGLPGFHRHAGRQRRLGSGRRATRRPCRASARSTCR